MKTIGLIGGMSWESSLMYYQLVNTRVKELLGGFHSCKNIMVSVDFAEIEHLQRQQDWQALDIRMADAAKQVEAAGADIVLLCTNTMHLCSKAITENISIPFLHIAEATGEEIVKKNFAKVGLLGTNFTMEKPFYKEILTKKYGIEVVIPSEEERKAVHEIIYKELVQGQINPSSREVYKQIIYSLHKRGAQGIVLGCTEIPLLISDADVEIPTFNTTQIHAYKAVEWALR
jgi:aspartate racemase